MRELVLPLVIVAVACQASAQERQAAIGRAVQKLRGGQPVEAEKILRQVTAAHPDQARGWYLLGYALHVQKKYRPALAAYAKAELDAEFRGRATYNAACIHAIQGRSDEAFALLRKAVELKAAGRSQLPWPSAIPCRRSQLRISIRPRGA